MEFHDENERHEVEADNAPASWALSGEERRVWELERFDDLPMCLSLEAIGQMLGVSRSTAYNMRKDGTIHALKLGSRWIVTRHELLRVILSSGPPSAAA